MIRHLFSPQQRTLIKLHKLTFLIDRMADHALAKRSHITLGQFRLLMALRYHRALSQKNVAQFHGLTEAAISRVVETLVKSKSIIRQSNPTNRREHILLLTPAGERQVNSAIKTLSHTFERLFTVLKPAEQRQFDAVLDRLLGTIWQSDRPSLPLSLDKLVRTRYHR